MKKLLLISVLLCGIVLAGCTSNQEISLLKEQNALLQQQVSHLTSGDVSTGKVEQATGVTKPVIKPKVKKVVSEPSAVAENTTQNIVVKQNVVEKSTADLYFEQQMAKDQEKQGKIKSAEQRKFVCYDAMESIINSPPSGGPIGDWQENYEVNHPQNGGDLTSLFYGYSKCDESYANELRIINLEY